MEPDRQKREHGSSRGEAPLPVRVLPGAVSVALLIAGTSGLGAPNPATYVIVPVMLIVLTLLASYFPARRASRVDPLRALRYE
jgi:ABC-type antimicrobial peptide transport system permease subunit